MLQLIDDNNLYSISKVFAFQMLNSFWVWLAPLWARPCVQLHLRGFTFKLLRHLLANAGLPKYRILFDRSFMCQANYDCLFDSVKILLVCGLGILILGTVANIYAEEEYSETHAGVALPPNLKQIESNFNLVHNIESPEHLNYKILGDNSLNDPLSFNRSAFS